MNTITASMHRSKYAKSAHPVLDIDGTPIEKWIKGLIFDQSGNDDTDELVPAQGWLIDDDHLEYAWRVLNPLNCDSSTFVPLLICRDDMDLSCTVAVVEQIISEDRVIWTRFGLAVEVTNGIIVSVAWNPVVQRAEFKRDQFENAYAELKRLTTEVWR